MAANGAGLLAATTSTAHLPPLGATTASLSASPLHRTWPHMSTEDVIAACTLQVVSPNARQVAWLPTSGGGGGGAAAAARQGAAGLSGSADGGVLLRPHQSTLAMAASAPAFSSPSPAANSAEGAAAAAAGVGAAGPAATLAGPVRADSGTSSDGEAPPAASAATPTPENSVGAGSHRASVDAGSVHDDASERGELRRNVSASATYADLPNTAMTSMLPAPQLRLSAFVPTLPSASALSQSVTSTPSPASHAVATTSAASSVYHYDAYQQLRASPPAAAAATAGSPTPPPTPYPPLASVRTPALSSQAAALVELRVRSAQHAALIQRIRVPTLLVHARDDPVAPTATLPFSLLQANPWITTVLTRRGSHAVFMEGAAEVWRRPRLVVTQYWHDGGDGADGDDSDDGYEEAHGAAARQWTPRQHRRRERRRGAADDEVTATHEVDVRHWAESVGDRSAGVSRKKGKPASPPWQPLATSPMLPAHPPAAAPPHASLTLAANRQTPLLAVAALSAGETGSPARGTDGAAAGGAAGEGASTRFSSSPSSRTFSTAPSFTTRSSSCSASSSSNASGGELGAGVLSGGIVEWLPVKDVHTLKGRGAAAAGGRPSSRVGASPVVPSHWQVRMEGTTWLERLIFEYVEKVVLSAATPAPPPAPLSPANPA